MQHGEAKGIDSQKFQGSFTFKRIISILEKYCGKASWHFLTEKSAIKSSGVNLEGGRRKIQVRKVVRASINFLK